MEDQDYILFDQYILEELSSEDVLAFEERLKSDSTFKTAFTLYKDVASHLENTISNEAETNAFKTNLESISNAHFNKTETKTVTKQKTKTFKLFQYAIAASIALLIGVVGFNQFSGVNYNDFNSHEPMTVVRGDVKDLLEITKAFNNKEFKKANTLLKPLLEKDTENIELKLYYAITNIELDKFKAAETMLIGISEGNSAYKNRAIWYLALSKLKQKDNDASIALLKQIPEDADDYRQAQKLLDKLE